jgi:NADPH:quinone reductase
VAVAEAGSGTDRRCGSLVDLANDTETFGALAALVRKGGTALRTRYVANADDLEARDVTAVNFQLPASVELLQRVADALASRRIVPIRL